MAQAYKQTHAVSEREPYKRESEPTRAWIGADSPLYKLHCLLESEPAVIFLLWGHRRNDPDYTAEFGPSLAAAVGLLADVTQGGPLGPPRQELPPDHHARIAAEVSACVQDLRRQSDLDFACWWQVRGEDRIQEEFSENAPLREAVSSVADAMAYEIDLYVEGYGEP